MYNYMNANKNVLYKTYKSLLVFYYSLTNYHLFSNFISLSFSFNTAFRAFQQQENLFVTRNTRLLGLLFLLIAVYTSVSI